MGKWAKGRRKETTDHARIYERIFELGVAGQELFSEERGVFDVGVHGNVERQLGRRVREADCFYHCLD